MLKVIDFKKKIKNICKYVRCSKRKLVQSDALDIMSSKIISSKIIY